MYMTVVYSEYIVVIAVPGCYKVEVGGGIVSASTNLPRQDFATSMCLICIFSNNRLISKRTLQ